jgi:Immunity protein family (Imm11)
LGQHDQREEMKMTDGVVYGIGTRQEAPHTIGCLPLDGDVNKIEYVDKTFDKGHTPLFDAGELYAGRAVKPDHVPTRAQWASKRYSPPDVVFSRKMYFVSEAFKDIIERHEPSVHQFFPVEFLYKDGSFARQMYFFNICTRLDGMDRERATAQLRKGIAFDPRTGDFLFSLKQIGDAHAWVDKHVIFGNFLSSTVVDEMKQQGLTGIVFNPFKAV